MPHLKTVFRQLDSLVQNFRYYWIARRYGGDEERLVEFILAVLKRSPYWAAGHAKLARLYLRKSEIQKAYYATQTYRVLVGEADWEGRYLLGVCYLRNGSLAQAEAVLSEAHNHHPDRYEISEELAAALMGLGKYLEATEVIASIPQDKRSGELLAALTGCEEALRR